MSKDCVLYLVRTSQDDLDMLNRSLGLVESHVLSSIKERTDVILFHEKSFDETYKNRVRALSNGNIIFQEIEFKVPEYSKQEIADHIPEFYPHPTHAKNGPHGETYFKEHGCFHPGFTMGYRHMCRFFSGWMYDQPILKNYEYYLRLDTDSFVLSMVPYDIFEWMRNNKCEYGFIDQAVQQDNPMVVEGLWKTIETWVDSNNIQVYKPISQIPDGRMFYTNFEVGKVSSFTTGSAYYNFYNFIDSVGGIYTKRWGDAPIKFLGVTLFVSPQTIKAVRGFIYQHGAVYHL